MYITTFYSFKGGVGRTMALVNAAVILALRGRRVLVVDFDIEAPGLDTFDVLQPRDEVPGLINFVADYVMSGESPDVADYIGNCPDIGEEGGGLWIMPSGKSDTYAATLGQINWIDLYNYRDGYVLFEDLRKQWWEALRPDYVLIDSRTGHTDSSGICTRQLPDSVIILFFPNEQNLRGLTQVVRDIRAESDGPRDKSIALHFVMSNVPDLDDEDLILKDKISAFKQELDLKRDPMVVHRYDSLSLLNQAVFSKDRPRSRLTQEYSHLVQEIIARNWKDREGALEYIRRARGHIRWLEDNSILTHVQSLEKIERSHQEDGEVLYRLAKLKETDRESEAAAQLINQAIHHGYDLPDAYLMRARFRNESNELIGAEEDAWRVLDSKHVTPPMVREAARILAGLGKSEPERLIKSNAVSSLNLNGKARLAETYNRSRDQLLIAVALWEPIVAFPDLGSGMRSRSRHNLGLVYMGLGQCAKAAKLFRKPNSKVAEMGIIDAFNYGMACWGADGIIHRDIFERAVEIDQSDNDNFETAHYFQCMAIAYWATGEIDIALDKTSKSQKSITDRRTMSEFSCWRYLQVDAETFESDLNEIREMIEKNEIRKPAFLVEVDPK
ncbi:MAG: ParA family protein [Rhodobacteraceae bacterium]|nr:ParA family protein [Paracoccaceae bacterium]MCY4195421.1 ParA family protein [Paracoccaceae bacterium]MCY4326041.1 ParA family protein [Paracoccaceae bacterium]